MKMKLISAKRVKVTSFLIGLVGCVMLVATARAEECFTKEIKGLTISNCVDGKPIESGPMPGQPLLTPHGFASPQQAMKPVLPNLLPVAEDKPQATLGQRPAFELGAQRVYGSKGYCLNGPSNSSI